MNYRKASVAFALLELLAVILVTFILFALLLPQANRLMAGAKRTQCASNLRQIGVGLFAYASDNQGCFPPGYVWDKSIAPYLNIDKTTIPNAVFKCPMDKRSLSKKPRSYSAVTYDATSDGRFILGAFSSSATEPSQRPAAFATPGNSIIMSEIFTQWNKKGSTGTASIDNLQYSPAYSVMAPNLGKSYGYHGTKAVSTPNPGNYDFGIDNYLFADGHVEPLTGYDTQERGAWTTQKK